jgi:hypothetical protein
VKVLATLIVVAALVVAITPQFTNCEAQRGGMLGMAAPAAATTVVAKMKCYWTAHAEIAVGIPLAAAGVLLLFARRKESKRAIGVLTALLGLSAVLLPATLIGTCASSVAVCDTTMKPLLLVAGGIVIAVGVVVVVLAEIGTEGDPGDRASA